MIYVLHLLLAVSLFAAAFAGAIHSKLARRVRYLSFVYFGWSLTGQVLALPLLILTIGSLYFALSKVQLSPVIAIVNLATLALFALTLLRAWQGSQALSQVMPDGKGASIGRFVIGALFPFQFPKPDVKRLKNVAYGPSDKKNNSTSICLKQSLYCQCLSSCMFTAGDGLLAESISRRSHSLSIWRRKVGWSST
ncbi:MAG: hypothetical protein ACJAW1_002914 [Glaciecola sp.]|jgi:hypothetical protein